VRRTSVVASWVGRSVEHGCAGQPGVGAARTDISESAAEFLDEPVLTLKAIGTTVVPKEHQRFDH